VIFIERERVNCGELKGSYCKKGLATTLGGLNLPSIQGG